MKKIYTLLIIALAVAITTVSCSKDSLETSPTTAVSGDGLFTNATAALVPLNGIYRSMYTAGWSTGGNTHQCFGITAYNLMADVMGEDHIMSGQGSGWFWYDCTYNVKARYTSNAWRSYDLWNAYYTWVANANYIIAAEETMEGLPSDVNYVIGAAYAIRAYSYFMLMQSFARTYKGHESEPGVPIYTEPSAAGTEGQPRSTVQQVYDLIVADIDKSVALLKDARKQIHKSHIDYYVAQGIAARIYLTMENWGKARDAAAEARKSTSIGDKADLTGGMNAVKAKNVMWGAEIISDQSGIYASFLMHMCHDSPGYGNTAFKRINKELYAKMGPKDVRLVWWDPAHPSGAYQQLKFKWADMSLYTGDYLWMRNEEMVLTQAEAELMLGNEAEAKRLLMELMSKRDPDYTVNKTGTAMGALTSNETGSLREEIINQRRIELWGEYGRLYDIRRLKQGFTRTTAMGWPTAALIPGTNTQNPASYAWVLTIPQHEFDGNKNLNQATDQNPMDDGV
ncbi:MAG: RagB/SusD family nutrient uptake outer membrane protein [Bacteroidales bacterium]